MTTNIWESATASMSFPSCVDVWDPFMLMLHGNCTCASNDGECSKREGHVGIQWAENQKCLWKLASKSLSNQTGLSKGVQMAQLTAVIHHLVPLGCKEAIKSGNCALQATTTQKSCEKLDQKGHSACIWLSCLVARQVKMVKRKVEIQPAGPSAVVQNRPFGASKHSFCIWKCVLTWQL